MKKVLLIIISLLVFIPTVSAKDKVTISVFYSESCIHCKHLHSYLDDLSKDSKYGSMIKIDYYEINKTKNQELFRKVAAYYHISTGVPVYIVGEDLEQGFPNIESDSEQVQESIRKKDELLKSRIEYAYENHPRDIVNEIKTGKIEVTTTEKRTVPLTSEDREELAARVDKSEEKNYLLYGIFVPVVLILFVILLFSRKKEVKE